MYITSLVLWKSSRHRDCGLTVSRFLEIFGSTHITFRLSYCYKARALIIWGFSLPLHSSLSYYLVVGTYTQTAMKMSVHPVRRWETAWADVGSWRWVELTASLYQNPHSGVLCDVIPGVMWTIAFSPEIENVRMISSTGYQHWLLQNPIQVSQLY